MLPKWTMRRTSLLFRKKGRKFLKRLGMFLFSWGGGWFCLNFHNTPSWLRHKMRWLVSKQNWTKPSKTIVWNCRYVQDQLTQQEVEEKHQKDVETKMRSAVLERERKHQASIQAIHDEVWRMLSLTVQNRDKQEIWKSNLEKSMRNEQLLKVFVGAPESINHYRWKSSPQLSSHGTRKRCSILRKWPMKRLPRPRYATFWNPCSDNTRPTLKPDLKYESLKLGPSWSLRKVESDQSYPH